MGKCGIVMHGMSWVVEMLDFYLIMSILERTDFAKSEECYMEYHVPQHNGVDRINTKHTHTNSKKKKENCGLFLRPKPNKALVQFWSQHNEWIKKMEVKCRQTDECKMWPFYTILGWVLSDLINFHKVKHGMFYTNFCLFFLVVFPRKEYTWSDKCPFRILEYMATYSRLMRLL